MRFLVYFLFGLVSFGRVVYATDKLDVIKDNSQLMNDLKDVYRAYNINHTIDDQNEMLNLLANESPNDIGNYVDVCLAENKKLTASNINDKGLKIYVDSYLLLTNRNYTAIKKNGIVSEDFTGAYEKFKAMNRRYMAYLTTRFAVERYVNMSEDDYWKTNNKKNYIKSPQYEICQKLLKTNFTQGCEILDNLIGKTKEFQEKTIYELERADLFVKYDSSNKNAHRKAIEIYKSIPDTKKYCLYLYESWLKWRMVHQYWNGLSKSSDIPNKMYEGVREEVAAVILSYIRNHPKDEMAINQFLVAASHDIVRRFGSYPYGNQITIEYHETFDDPK